MELIECIKSSLENQAKEPGNTLYPSSERTYISSSLDWLMSIEGFLFWAILHNSYYYHGTYDYITIVKLYKKYGKEVFNKQCSIYSVYRNTKLNKRKTLSRYRFFKLELTLKRDGAIKRIKI